MRQFFRLLRQSSSSWRSVGDSSEVNKLAGKYMWVGKSWEKYIGGRKVLLTNKE